MGNFENALATMPSDPAKRTPAQLARLVLALEADGAPREMRIALSGEIIAYEKRRAAMNRDMDVIRAIIQHIQARTDLKPKRVEIEGLDDEIVQAHVWMLEVEGMLNNVPPTLTSSSPSPLIFVRDLSWQGHELAAVLSETSWDRIRAKLSPAELAGLSLKMVLEVGNAVGLAWAKAKLGLP